MLSHIHTVFFLYDLFKMRSAIVNAEKQMPVFLFQGPRGPLGSPGPSGKAGRRVRVTQSQYVLYIEHSGSECITHSQGSHSPFERLWFCLL